MRTLTLIVLPIVMAASGENFPGGRCYVILASWGRKRKKLRARNTLELFLILTTTRTEEHHRHASGCSVAPVSEIADYRQPGKLRGDSWRVTRNRRSCRKDRVQSALPVVSKDNLVDELAGRCVHIQLSRRYVLNEIYHSHFSSMRRYLRISCFSR